MEIASEESEEPQKLVKVPPYHLCLLALMNASWLNVNDTYEKDCNRLFIGGNVNLALICALLFTTFLPIYYSEANRLDVPDDGLTLDIAHGYLSPISLSNDTIHDIFDCSYLIATAGTLFGTMVSVFYMLAANETNDDAKTFVLLTFLGPHFSQLPFYFFSIGIIGWAVGAMFHVFVVARTTAGFYIKIISLWTLIIVMMMFAFPRMIQGTFQSRLDEQLNPPLYFSSDQIKEKLNVFFMNPNSNKDISLEEFLLYLTQPAVTKTKYRPPLQTLTKIEATCLYYEKLSSVCGRSVEEIKGALEAK